VLYHLGDNSCWRDRKESNLTIKEGTVVMVTERRRGERENVQIEASIILDQRELPGNLVSMSEYGAFVRVELNGNENVSESDTGRTVSLVMRDGATPIEKTGIICRYVEHRADKYLAIEFQSSP